MKMTNGGKWQDRWRKRGCLLFGGNAVENMGKARKAGASGGVGAIATLRLRARSCKVSDERFTKVQVERRAMGAIAIGSVYGGMRDA